MIAIAIGASRAQAEKKAKETQRSKEALEKELAVKNGELAQAHEALAVLQAEKKGEHELATHRGTSQDERIAGARPHTTPPHAGA